MLSKDFLSLKRTALLTTVGLSLLVLSCYPGSINIEEADIVSTNYDAAYFSGNSPSTYFLPDTVVAIGEDVEEAQLSREEMDFILNLIENNFEDLGYTRITEIEEDNLPDVLVTASALVVNVRGAGGCIPWWPGWGWYPWYPGWGWGPGWCYPSYVYSYDTGTLTIDMIAPDEEAGDEEIKRVWNAGLNGILRSNVSGNEKFVTDGINKAFELSEEVLRAN